MGIDATTELRLHFEDWLFEEAALLDEGRFEEWLERFDENTRYWAPVRANLARGEEPLDAPGRLTHFDEDKSSLYLRVARLATGFAHAEEPPSRTRHYVSNVRILDASDPERVVVASNLLVFKSREHRQEVLFSCTRRDRWRREGSGWLNEERMILFDHDVIESISIFF